MKQYNKEVMQKVVLTLRAKQGFASALGEAVRWSLVESVQELLAEGNDVDSPKEPNQSTALMLVSDPKIAKLLIEAGANPNARNKLGVTPLWALLNLYYPKGRVKK
jgi:ankyrin repeat protein